MAWEVIRIEDRFSRDDRPFVSVSAHRIAFSASFARQADIGTQHYVTIHAEPETLRLGFEFHTDKRLNSLKLVQDGASKTQKPGVFCSSHSAVNSHPWVRGVTKLQSRDRRFFPNKEGKLWVITLCPSFEIQFARESKSLPKDASGVYRYVREDGEIVYIGRGNIYKRLQSPDRIDWDFDVVDFSIVDDPDRQIYWERFWIEGFKEQNGRLPFYNKVSGASSINDEEEEASDA